MVQAQLQGNVGTCPICILHAFWVCSSSGKKGVAVMLSHAAALSQGFALAQMCLVHVTAAYRMCCGCILHVFQTCVNITLELSCTVSK